VGGESNAALVPSTGKAGQEMNPLLFVLVQGVVASDPPPLTVAEIVDHMVQADNERMAVFSGYTGLRRYTFENRKVNKCAEVAAQPKLRVSSGQIL